MKRLIGLVATATAFMVLPTTASNAGYPTDAPIVATNKPTYQTSEGGTATASNYKPGVAVTFSITGDFVSTPLQGARATAVSTTGIGSALANGSGIATIGFTAPAVTGVFTITATQGALTATTTITVVSATPPTTTTTTPPTTTAAPTTTTAAPTTTATTAAPTTSIAGVAALTPTAPSGGLPSTGSNSISWARVAAIATFTGVGLVLIARQRRRSRPATQ